MNVFISTDIEGITGIVSWKQAEGPGQGPDWAFARRMYVSDVNAAIRGAFAGGADRVVVKDSHGGCENLLIDELDPRAELISGWPGPSDLYMMQGIESGGFDQAFLIGYHAMAGTIGGVLEHALSGGLHRFWINDDPSGEMAMSAALAGEFGIPISLVTSDDAGCLEAESQLGATSYSTKTGLTRFSARLKHPDETSQGIFEAASEAVKTTDFRAFRPSLPVRLRVEFKETYYADLAASHEAATRLDGYTVEVQGDSVRKAHQRLCNVFALSGLARRIL